MLLYGFITWSLFLVRGVPSPVNRSSAEWQVQLWAPTSVCASGLLEQINTQQFCTEPPAMSGQWWFFLMKKFSLKICWIIFPGPPAMVSILKKTVGSKNEYDYLWFLLDRGEIIYLFILYFMTDPEVNSKGAFTCAYEYLIFEYVTKVVSRGRGDSWLLTGENWA